MDDRDKAKKKKRGIGRNRYLSDYTRNLAGEYVYTGDLYNYKEGSMTPKRRGLVYLGISAAVAAVFVSGLIADTPGGRALYVMLPYVLSFLPAAFLLIAAVEQLLIKGDLTFCQYETVYQRFHACAVCLIIFCTATLVGTAVFVCLHGGAAGELYIALPCAANIAISAIFLRLQKKNLCIKITKGNS